LANRKFQKKKRNDVKRQKKPVMTITAEGKNKTESLYFASFQDQYGKYNIKFVKTGLDTDPAGMLKSMNTYWKNNALSEKNGDKSYIVLDMDCNPEKIRLVEKLQKQSKNIIFITSNPCIEVWFLLHYAYSTHQYKDSREPKRELAKYIDGYEENTDIADIIRPYICEADNRVEQLKKNYESIGIKWGDVGCNPMTDVPIVLKNLGVL
jgi:hypothetical protein